MRNISKILVILIFVFLLQDCSINRVDNNFPYKEGLKTISGGPFRNRKYDYARVQVIPESYLKIPKSLNGNKISSVFQLPDDNKTYANSEVIDVERAIIPPNYYIRFNMSKIIYDEIANVSISVIYDDTGSIKLVFREPMVITCNLIERYFKDRSQNYKLLSVKDEILSGNIIKIQDNKRNLIFVIKIRKIDELSSLVKINAVFTVDDKAKTSYYINENSRLLLKIFKFLNGTNLKINSDIKIFQQIINKLESSERIIKDNISNIEESSKKNNNFSFVSDDKTMYKETSQKKEYQSSQEDYIKMSVPYIDTQYQILNT